MRTRAKETAEMFASQQQKLCHKCGIIVSNIYALNRHLFIMHGGCKPTRTKTIKGVNKKWESRKPRKCTKCDKFFVNKYTLQKHAVIHENISYKCIICGLCTLTEDAIHKHIFRVHQVLAIDGEKRYKKCIHPYAMREETSVDLSQSQSSLGTENIMSASSRYPTYRQRLNSYKLRHAIVASTISIQQCVLRKLLDNTDRIEESLKARKAQYTYEEFFDNDDRKEINEFTYQQFNIVLLHKITKWIYSSMEEKHSGSDTLKLVEKLIDWVEEITTDFTRILTAEDLNDGLGEVRVLTGNIIEILKLKGIVDENDYDRLHFRIQLIIEDVEEKINEK